MSAVRGVCPVRDILRTRGVLQMRTSALFGAKNFGFFKIYGVSARTGGKGVEPVRTREGPIFRDFVRTSFIRLKAMVTLS